MNDEDWKKYVDTGKVSYKIIMSIVNRIKKGEALGVYDIAVYSSNAEMIEVLLTKK